VHIWLLLPLVGAFERLSPSSAEQVDRQSDIPARQTITLCDLQGPGRIVRLWITLPVAWRGPVLRDAVLRMFWDNEPTPSVECPLGDFFGASFARPRRVVSDRLAITGGGYVCSFEMPFRERAVITVENQADRPLRLFVFQVGYYAEVPVPAVVETFHARWCRENPTYRDRSFVALDTRGQGRLVGLKLEMQNRSWWLRPPLREMFFPRGLGLGMLEGPERIFIDEDDSPSVVGTGTEDFFQGGWYFRGGPFQTPTHGVTVRSFLSGRVSAYRFFLNDPIYFERSIRILFDHGARNDVRADYASVVYWYQREPHSGHPPLPPAEERRPIPVFSNLLQPLGLLVPLLVLLGGLVWLARLLG